MKSITGLIFAIILLVSTSIVALAEATVAQLQADTEALFASGRALADVKLTVDHMVDPSTNVQAVKAMIDGMADDVKAMAGENAKSAENSRF